MNNGYPPPGNRSRAKASSNYRETESREEETAAYRETGILVRRRTEINCVRPTDKERVTGNKTESLHFLRDGMKEKIKQYPHPKREKEIEEEEGGGKGEGEREEEINVL